MRKSNIIDYKNPSQNLVTDVLSEFLRESAQKMLQLAIEEEVQIFMHHTKISYLLMVVGKSPVMDTYGAQYIDRYKGGSSKSTTGKR
jgi:TPP-dependent 2-oxoacid decarboxylase